MQPSGSGLNLDLSVMPQRQIGLIQAKPAAVCVNVLPEVGQQ